MASDTEMVVYAPGDLVVWQPRWSQPVQSGSESAQLRAVIVLEHLKFCSPRRINGELHPIELELIRGLRADNLGEVTFNTDELVPYDQLSK